MNFETIEKAYELLLENVQLLQNDLKTNSYDALIEQNAIYLDGKTENKTVLANDQALCDLNLSKESGGGPTSFSLLSWPSLNPCRPTTSLRRIVLVLSCFSCWKI